MSLKIDFTNEDVPVNAELKNGEIELTLDDNKYNGRSIVQWSNPKRKEVKIMSMIENVRSQMVEAMKSKDKDRKDALSMLLSALKNKAIDKRADLTEAEEFEVVKKEIKQTKETMELAPEGRDDIKQACQIRLDVYQEFAPEEMSEEAIREQVKEVLAALGITEPSGKDKGKVMKELMPRVKGRADGGLVNKIVGEMLG